MRKQAGLKRGTLQRRLLRTAAVGICFTMLVSNVPAGVVTVSDAKTITDVQTDKPVINPADEPTDEPDVLLEQEITVKVASKKYTGDSLKKAKKTFKIGASAMTDISYEVINGSKYISVNGNGVVTVKKNTPKGTYKIRVTAEATEEYEEAETIVTVTVTKATPVMKNTNINWNLKKNKSIKYSMDCLMYNNAKGKYYSKRKNGTVILKNFKKVSKGNKYTVSFTVALSQPTNYPQKEVNEIINAVGMGANFGTVVFWGAYDYQTGEYLDKANKNNVKVKYGKWKYFNKKRYDGSNGGWYEVAKTLTKKVTITYPKTYKDLCIVAGGYRKRDLLNDEIDCLKKTKNDKLYFHGIRIK